MLSMTLAAGCGNACLTLAAQVCVCLPDDGTRAACTQRAKDGQASFPLRSEDEQYCQAKIDSHLCDCNNLQKVEVRQACGLVYP